MPLTPEEQAILACEDTHRTQYARKPEDIRRELNLSHVRYQQRLHLLLTDPEAEAAHPMLIHRLRRLREASASRRADRARVRRSA
jgi:hypothetical protein